jgi:hypothetical protein
LQTQQNALNILKDKAFQADVALQSRQETKTMHRYQTVAAISYWAILFLLISGIGCSNGDDEDDSAAYQSSAIDSQGVVHVVWVDPELDYLYYANNSSGSWNPSRLDPYGKAGATTSMVIDGQDRVHVGFRADDSLLHAVLL